MSKLFTSALLAAALFVGTAPAMARETSLPDMSKPHGGFAPNSAEGQRAFWEYRSRHGGN